MAMLQYLSNFMHAPGIPNSKDAIIDNKMYLLNHDLFTF